MEKSITIIISLLFFCLQTFSQSPNWLWAKSAGGSNDDNGKSIAIDGNGNSYVTGYFSSPAISFGLTTLTCAGNHDMFIAKYDGSGNAVWAKSAGGSNIDEGTGIAVDNIGNSYVIGYFNSSTITFDTITLTNDSIGFADIFIVKYDVSGNVIWAKSAGGNDVDEGLGIAVDGSGNIYVTGVFGSSTITFDTITLTNAGTYGMFIAKYNSSGNALWARNSGGSLESFGNSIAVDGSGTSYVTGYFLGANITFDTILINNVGGNFTDIFIVKYDASGNMIWAKGAGGDDQDLCYSIAIDGNGNSFITGSFESSNITFGTISLTNAYAGTTDVFIAKYDSNGDAVWAKRAGGNDWEEGTSVAVDGIGNSYFTGVFQSSTITFGTYILNNVGGPDMFFVKYDTSGNVVWAKSVDGSDQSNSIAVDGSNNCYVTGSFSSPTINFDSTTLTRAGSNDIFVARLGNTFTSLSEVNIRQGLIIYPNPTSTFLNIHQSNPSPNQQLIITDLLGAEVYKEMLIGIDNSISISTWRAGIYFYEVRNNTDIARGKFVKE
jgi:hypothetical protein